MTTHEINRRTLLRAAGGAAVAAAGLPLVQSCGGDDGSEDTTGLDSRTTTATAAASSGSGGNAQAPSASTDSILPAFEPRVVAEPDLAGDDNGTPDAYLAYPANPVRAAENPPLKGGSVDILKLVWTALPPPMDKNPFWRELNKRAGATLNMNNVIAADYRKKVATVVAGGDLPDVMQLGVNYLSHAGEFLQKACEDLSPWLSGDAVKKYPYLAALPTVSWRNVVFNGGIYGIPFPLGITGSDNKIRQDIVSKLGLSTEMSNGDDFVKLCEHLTDAGKNRYAITTISAAQGMVNEMVGVPNTYRVTDGQFINAVQTDEYKQALGICQQLWKKNLIFPDSLTSASGFHQWFTSGRALIVRDGYTNWANLTSQGTPGNASFKIGGLVLPKWDGGGQAGHYTGSGMVTFTAVKKAKKARIEELLELFNWFVTPFGTEDYLFRKYGIMGRDYTLDGTDPVWTETGVNEVQHMTVSGIGTPPQPLYMPGHPELAKADHAYLQQLMRTTVPLPTIGLVSDTQLEKGSSLNQIVTDGVNDVVTGRKSVADWDVVVKKYLSAGGDAINKEYSRAYADAN